jgi:TolB-like protein
LKFVMMARLELLGGFSLSSQAQTVVVPAKKNRALLGILALAPHCEVTRDRLAALLWSDRGEEQAKNSLRQALVTLRKDFVALDADLLVSKGDRLALDRHLVTVDVVKFLGASASIDPTELRLAAELYKGPFLDGLSALDNAFEDWLRDARADLNARAIKVFSALAKSVAGLEGIAIAERLIALEPLREASHIALMEAHISLGQAALAIKQYETYKLFLKRELGAEPTEELEKLRRSLDGASERHFKGEATSSDKPVIAVLPFANMSGDKEQQYFSDGITEDIITELSRFRSLYVIARNSSFQYREKAVDVRRVASELAAEYVVEGSIRKFGNRLRITAQLIDASTGNHLWSERYDRDIDALFELQDELTRTIVATLTGRVEDAEISAAVRKHTGSLAAYDKVLRGIEHIRGWGTDENRLGWELFEAAIALDPHCALAHAYRSLSLLLEHDFENAPQTIKDEAIDGALTAVRLDAGGAQRPSGTKYYPTR